MAVNKVEYGDTTLIDLTSDTVDEQSVLSGRSFHAADGTIKEGKVVVAEVVDNLTSTSTEDALSANQGRILGESRINYSYADGKLSINGGFSGGSSSSHTYSTEEQVVGTWIDGKPVYEKTYIKDSASVFGSSWSTFVPVDSDIQNAKLIQGFNGSDNVSTENYGSACSTSLYRIANGNLMVFCSAGQYIKFITIQYTKTTD